MHCRSWAGGEDEMGGCADLDALVAMVPPSVPLLDAAVRELPELWRDVFSHDDTGRHTNYSELEAFANGLRDADDMRVAARRAAQVEATPLPTRRIPEAVLRPLLTPGSSGTVEHELAMSHTLVVHLHHAGALTMDGPETGHPRDPTWTTTMDQDLHVLSVSEPPGVVVAKEVNAGVVAMRGDGQDRAIATESYGDRRFSVYVSRDAGATWTLGLASAAGNRVRGDPRSFDYLLDAPLRWIHIGADGVLAPTIASIGRATNGQWTCATSEVLFLADGDAHLLHWTDRTGAHGSMPYNGSGQLACAGRALLGSNDYGRVRCVAGNPACGDANHWGYGELASDGVFEGLVVWSDIPTLIVRGPDRVLRTATPP